MCGWLAVRVDDLDVAHDADLEPADAHVVAHAQAADVVASA